MFPRVAQVLRYIFYNFVATPLSWLWVLSEIMFAGALSDRHDTFEYYDYTHATDNEDDGNSEGCDA